MGQTTECVLGEERRVSMKAEQEETSSDQGWQDRTQERAYGSWASHMAIDELCACQCTLRGDVQGNGRTGTAAEVVTYRVGLCAVHII